MSVEAALLVVGGLLLAAVFAVRVSERVRAPALLLFLAVGMLAGSEGPGGLEFDSPELAQAAGTAALAVILFAGGLDTRWSKVRPVVAPGLLLATLGVVVTAVALGSMAWWLLGTFTDFDLGSVGLSWPEALLLGAIVSSTDAAALFVLFRSGGAQPDERTRGLLELESGTNDPVAVIVTTTVLGVLTLPTISGVEIVRELLLQITLGVFAGAVLGGAGAWLTNRLTIAAPGLYPVFVLAVGLVTFGLTDLIGGNEFLAVYVAGLFVGNLLRRHRGLILDVTDAFSWLAQIGMFLVLGLLVFPSELADVAPVAIALAFALMLIARPLGVLVCLTPFRFSARVQAYVSWAGLKGAVPIVLATFPATYGLTTASDVFNVVFFIVVVSVLVQGLTLGPAARRLGVVGSAP